ncbi:beta-1,4-glucuronyltransferase 1-like [Anthonomus grandis grandis]|uniref:beta-1,4-glucuronyltransferase 1-like n=1 Tax=Anthonomus grandis grandis TaxID=2921223 RepID=UPI0021655BBC|nr:beta-1,4-glucuronyltransferase 1-like [Anthonomus grandis grandis]
MVTIRFLKFFIAAFFAIFIILLLTRDKVPQLQEFNARNAYQATETASEKDDTVPVEVTEIKTKPLEDSANLEEIVTNINSDKEVKEEDQENDKEEIDDSNNDVMPAAFLNYRSPTSENKSYCKFSYGLPYSLTYLEEDMAYPPQGGKESTYRVLYNAIFAYNIENVSSITYATHLTANYGNFIPELLKRWDGLVTIAAFVPDVDSFYFLEQINQFCYCEPKMHRVSIHLVTQERLPFSKNDISFGRPDSCLPKDSSQLVLYKDFDNTVTYPVNVVRNVARVSALSRYVLLSDIELMPNKGLAKSFLNFQENFNKTIEREVFVLPVFEVDEAESVPENKEELLRLIEDDKAIYFHGLVCQHCQRFPLFEKWLQSGFSDDIKPFVTVKRHDPYYRWEPIFIGTNEEPLYNEELTWEGLQDKMSQSLEMCLLDYHYTVLDNAFLCHWPGMKKKKPTKEEWRSKFITNNTETYKKIIRNLLERYDNIPECRANFMPQLVP